MSPIVMNVLSAPRGLWLSSISTAGVALCRVVLLTMVAERRKP